MPRTQTIKTLHEPLELLRRDGPIASCFIFEDTFAATLLWAGHLARWAERCGGLWWLGRTRPLDPSSQARSIPVIRWPSAICRSRRHAGAAQPVGRRAGFTSGRCKLPHRWQSRPSSGSGPTLHRSPGGDGSRQRVLTAEQRARPRRVAVELLTPILSFVCPTPLGVERWMPS